MHLRKNHGTGVNKETNITEMFSTIVKQMCPDLRQIYTGKDNLLSGICQFHQVIISHLRGAILLPHLWQPEEELSLPHHARYWRIQCPSAGV